MIGVGQLVLLKGNESVVCEICNVCFNTKERRPLILCSHNHSACQTCVDGIKSKGMDQCPFCRTSINLNTLKPNEELMRDLEKYEKEKKSLSPNVEATLAPRTKTQNELIKETI